MSWARTAGICATLAALPSMAQAQGGLTGRIRYQGGYTHETPEVLDSPHDLWAGVVPEVSYLFVERRWLLRMTYAFTANVHTRNPTEIANRFSAVSSYDVSPRTTVLLSADANQTSLSNFLLTRPALDTSAVVVPASSNSRFLTMTASQGLTYEVSPSVRFGQGIDVTHVVSLDSETPIQNSFANALLSLERTWKRDGVGAELRGGYATFDTPPVRSRRFVTITAAPRWRHDLSLAWTSSLSGGASLTLSPDEGTEPIVTPFGRAALLYSVDTSSLELSYAGGATPNALTGQMLRSHQVTLRGATPLSERHRVFAGSSIGYLHGSVIDLRSNATATPDIDAILSDIEVTWLATQWMQLFARGLFLAQDNGSGAPPFVREAVVVGIQLSTRAPDGVVIPLRFPQRVDRSDGASR